MRQFSLILAALFSINAFSQTQDSLSSLSDSAARANWTPTEESLDRAVRTVGRELERFFQNRLGVQQYQQLREVISNSVTEGARLAGEARAVVLPGTNTHNVILACGLVNGSVGLDVGVTLANARCFDVAGGADILVNPTKYEYAVQMTGAGIVTGVSAAVGGFVMIASVKTGSEMVGQYTGADLSLPVSAKYLSLNGGLFVKDDGVSITPSNAKDNDKLYIGGIKVDLFGGKLDQWTRFAKRGFAGEIVKITKL